MGKGNIKHMANSAIGAENVLVHRELDGPLFLDIEDIWMTTGAIQFAGMVFMEKPRCSGASRTQFDRLAQFFRE